MGDVCWCNVARILLPVQKTAALLTSRSLESWEEKGHLGFHCFFYLPSPAELQQPPVRPAHVVSFTGCFCHLLLPRPSSIPPHSQGNHNTIPCTQRGSAPRQPQDQLPPSSNLCPSHKLPPSGHWDMWILWIARLRKGGPLNNEFQLCLERSKAHPISSLQHPTEESPHIGHHPRPSTVPHT